MTKTVQVIMLPQNKNNGDGLYVITKGDIIDISGRLSISQESNLSKYIQAQHLYLINIDDVIKEGDWIIKIGEFVTLAGKSEIDYLKIDKNYFYKIIASTDMSLGLPGIPSMFIKKYVNSNGSIKEVEVPFFVRNDDGCPFYWDGKLFSNEDEHGYRGYTYEDIKYWKHEYLVRATNQLVIHPVRSTPISREVIEKSGLLNDDNTNAFGETAAESSLRFNEIRKKYPNLAEFKIQELFKQGYTVEQLTMEDFVENYLSTCMNEPNIEDKKNAYRDGWLACKEHYGIK